MSAYGPGGHFASHLDTLRPQKWAVNPEGYPQISFTNRMVTVILYLTTCPQGGETEFINLPVQTDQSLTAQLKSLFISPKSESLSIKPQMGSALIFFPACSPSAPGDLKNAPDPFTQHRAAPVVTSKWIAQQWIWGTTHTNSHKHTNSQTHKLTNSHIQRWTLQRLPDTAGNDEGTTLGSVALGHLGFRGGRR